MADRPLGKILQIHGEEAITQPHQPFLAVGATVVTTDNRIIGKLSRPIGRVDHPYQVVKLNSADPSLLGQFVIAKVSNKKRKKHHKSRR